jgi:hypothetical protein
MAEPVDVSKKHFYVSLAKSGVRIAAGVALCMGSLFVSGMLFVAAEILGIVEEL